MISDALRDGWLVYVGENGEAEGGGLSGDVGVPWVGVNDH